MVETALPEVSHERDRLLAVAYRLLGTVADAEDAVQETYARWLRLSDAERAAVQVPRAWLVRVCGRVCLDVLGSARVRREQYVGEWLPEPVPARSFAYPAIAADDDDPAERVVLDDAVSLALLVVLESTTPAERVCFVLHDVFAVPFTELADVVGRTPAACRQLATSARRRVRDDRGRTVPRAEREAVVRAFAQACRGGDLGALIGLLDPEVALRADGGGAVSSARRPVVGASNVARFLLGILAKVPPFGRIEVVDTGDGTAFALYVGDAPYLVLTPHVVDGAIGDVWIVLNPAKLGRWAGLPDAGPREIVEE